MVLAVQGVDETVARELVHAHARHAREVQLLETRLALVVLLHVSGLQGYSPVRLVHVHREASRNKQHEKIARAVNVMEMLQNGVTARAILPS